MKKLLPDVTGVGVGDLVIVPWAISCGRCAACAAGLRSKCAPALGDKPLAAFGFGEAIGGHGGMVSDLLRIPWADEVLVLEARPESALDVADVHHQDLSAGGRRELCHRGNGRVRHPLRINGQDDPSVHRHLHPDAAAVAVLVAGPFDPPVDRPVSHGLRVTPSPALFGYLKALLGPSWLRGAVPWTKIG